MWLFIEDHRPILGVKALFLGICLGWQLMARPLAAVVLKLELGTILGGPVSALPLLARAKMASKIRSKSKMLLKNSLGSCRGHQGGRAEPTDSQG